MNDLAALRDLTLFAGLSEEQLAAAASVGRRRRASAGMAILREGERGDSLFVLLAGSVETTKRLGLAAEAPGETEREKVLVRLVAPQVFGEMGLLEDAERSATVTAQTECELLEVSRADFEKLAQADPVLGYRLVRNIATVLSSRLRASGRDVVKLTLALSLALGNR